jgi:predicted peroxiredoxin
MSASLASGSGGGIKKGDLVDGAKLAGAATYIELLSDPSFAVVNF